jgi:hypothetical protein
LNFRSAPRAYSSDPTEAIHPVRAAEIQAATNFDHLVAQNLELQSMIERARPRIFE